MFAFVALTNPLVMRPGLDGSACSMHCEMQLYGYSIIVVREICKTKLMNWFTQKIHILEFNVLKINWTFCSFLKSVTDYLWEQHCIYLKAAPCQKVGMSQSLVNTPTGSFRSNCGRTRRRWEILNLWKCNEFPAVITATLNIESRWIDWTFTQIGSTWWHKLQHKVGSRCKQQKQPTVRIN